MKHLKIYEDYSIDDIYNWWLGINVSENDEYYILNLKNVYLTNKIYQLNNGLRDKLVKFYCKEHMKYEEVIIKNVYIDYDSLLFKTQTENKLNIVHPIDTNKPISISKIYLNMKKYNL